MLKSKPKSELNRCEELMIIISLSQSECNHGDGSSPKLKTCGRSVGGNILQKFIPL